MNIYNIDITINGHYYESADYCHPMDPAAEFYREFFSTTGVISVCAESADEARRIAEEEADITIDDYEVDDWEITGIEFIDKCEMGEERGIDEIEIERPRP